MAFNSCECANPGETCKVCREIILKDVPESCPACGLQDTYVTHASKHIQTCIGCEDKFCTACFHGCRYYCTYVYGSLSAPPPISRECSEEKWVAAENYLRAHPEKTSAVAEYIPGYHVYTVIRSVIEGHFVREHSILSC